MNLEVFSRKTELPVSAEEAFAWHERPGAFERLVPPWESVRVIRRDDGLQDGSRVVFVNSQGPAPLRWTAEHADYQYGRQFRDVQVRGPFRHWVHTHRFIPQSDGTSVLEDHIEYAVPGGGLGRIMAGGLVRRKLAAAFAYRHKTTVDDLAAHRKHRRRGPIHVAITGASGLIGRELRVLLTTGGHQVTQLVRGEASQEQIAWDPNANSFDATALSGVTAVVHLAGENIASSRWTEAQKRRIIDSRVHSTRVLCEGLAEMASPPQTLVSASAIGFYGERADSVVDEDSSSGDGFLADVARRWEAATEPAAAAGIRIVHMRFGIVLSPKGGALAKLLTPFSLGGGGPIGDGRQYWSWISLDDAAGAIHHALMTDDVRGPVNAVSPAPVTNAAFVRTLGRVLSRPSVIRMPAFAARIALGEMANELLLTSARVHPGRLSKSAYEFRNASLEDALRRMLGRTKPPE